MTQPARTVLHAMIGGVITFLGSLLLLVLSGAWGLKENTSDHRADVQALRSDIRRVLDVVCLDKPSAPQCK